ncbi:hypothetical protein PAESOLCIP111_03636 [Paenibacillus solanacearum]|uniref:Uncharacterized protein n=1 Tax=Paenibacillus solanacearum TaxID=2048548 RepID=A0A916NQF7_9BACL|nr:hypothetical protein [Paenibacillus solanacearum]CAG7635197.1 hypothetical protein PAESOLCIP111_03636 [Paenibacillus solanacearum]
MAVIPFAAGHLTLGQVVFRLAAAVLLGGMLGVTGRVKRRGAAVWVLASVSVCLLSAAVMLLCVYGMAALSEAGALVHFFSAHAYGAVISVIGFMAGGLLFGVVPLGKDMEEVSQLFVTMVIGFCTGDGFYECAVLCALIGVLVVKLPVSLRSNQEK